jgi:hypothetical protein
MSLTQEAWDRIIKGKFPDGFVRGRLAIGLERSDSTKAFIKIMILDKDENVLLFEYEESMLRKGEPIVLTGAEVKTAIKIVKEGSDG